MDQNGSLPGTESGQAAVRSLSVFLAGPKAGAAASVGADPAATGTTSAVTTASAITGSTYQDGFTGSLALQNLESLTEEQAGGVLSQLNRLTRWVQAQQAKVLSRMQNIYESESTFLSGMPDSDMAFSLAAEEAAAILGIPSGTGKALMSEAGNLCAANTATLGRLESGEISYAHAETVLEQCVGIAPADIPSFEAQLLELAAGQTKAQFRVRAQRLRENHYPETIVERQRTAFDQRRVWLRPEPDGMAWLSAMLPAEKALGIYHQLTAAARGEQAAGDSRTVDQLRTDILTDLLGGHGQDNDGDGDGNGNGDIDDRSRGRGGAGGRSRGKARRRQKAEGHNRRHGSSSDKAASGERTSSDKTGASEDKTGRGGCTRSDKAGPGEDAGTGSGICRISHGPRARTEILVIINAETLFGADDRPAELLGYGPLSPETARRMARKAARWTPAERDPDTEEILRVGRSRKPAAGLKRFLRARDGTCRFPGCRANAVISEIDHTKPWAQGGATDHDNLEHLCRRHHLFKTQGFWKAHQPSPGVIEWTSPGGRRYRTEPHLTLAAGVEGRSTPDKAGRKSAADEEGKAGIQGGDSHGKWRDLDDYGDDPPPF
ncbi:DUF222 domain-containing protein [Arthrobacter citreus]|uniref:HNH endonuclease n=1 Tax=Arthrobacter TaxID=1663 RepID=UPI00147982D0|nr:HNH endonuclease signature motif containing protein [Arthrobacter gandavensis]